MCSVQCEVRPHRVGFDSVEMWRRHGGCMADNKRDEEGSLKLGQLITNTQAPRGVQSPICALVPPPRVARMQCVAPATYFCPYTPACSLQHCE